MTTNHDKKGGNPVLGDQSASSSSSSSKSGNTVDAQGGPQDEVQEEVLTNPVNVAVPITIPSIMTVPMTFKHTYSIAHYDWMGQHSIIFHVDLEHGGDSCGVLQLSVVV
jgi:hypothetical protein